MQRIYWRPKRVSHIQLAFISLFALAGLVAVENFRLEERQSHYSQKLSASRTARAAIETIKAGRLQRKIPIEEENDPAATGMVGMVISSVTSGAGSLASKQAAANPNLAAVVVEWLKKLHVSRGDTVAIGVSGSFPGANVAVYSAVHALGLKPIIISSAAASQWGANIPGYLWLDMERVLFQRGIFPFRSVAASRGGIGDQGLGMGPDGRRLIDEAILNSGAYAIRPKNNEEGVQERMKIYMEEADGAPIVAYINVGGGTLSVGTKVGKKNFRVGLNRRAPRAATEIPSVMGEFLKQGIPTVHIVQIVRIAENYGLSTNPDTSMEVGLGDVFVRREYNRGLAALVLLITIGAMVWLFRIPQTSNLRG